MQHTATTHPRRHVLVWECLQLQRLWRPDVPAPQRHPAPPQHVLNQRCGRGLAVVQSRAPHYGVGGTLRPGRPRGGTTRARPPAPTPRSTCGTPRSPPCLAGENSSAHLWCIAGLHGSLEGAGHAPRRWCHDGVRVCVCAPAGAACGTHAAVFTLPSPEARCHALQYVGTHWLQRRRWLLLRRHWHTATPTTGLQKPKNAPHRCFGKNNKTYDVPHEGRLGGCLSRADLGTS